MPTVQQLSFYSCIVSFTRLLTRFFLIAVYYFRDRGECVLGYGTQCMTLWRKSQIVLDATKICNK